MRGTVAFALPSLNSELFERDVVALALAHNAGIQQALFDYRLAQAEADAGRLDFDYFLTMIPAVKSDGYISSVSYERPTYTETTESVSLGLKHKIQTGLQAELTVQNMHVRTNSNQATLPDRKSAAVQGKVTQPLLRAVGSVAAAATLKKAVAKRTRYYWKLRETMDQKILDVINLYWSMQALQTELEVKTRAEGMAEKAVERMQARFSAGKTARTELLEAEGKLFMRRGELAMARSDRELASDKLWNEIAPMGSLLPQEALRAGKTDVAQSPPSIDRKQLALQPKVRRARQEEIEVEVDWKKARRMAWPQLDLSVQYTSVGLGVRNATAFDQVDSLKFPGWAVTLNFSMPWSNDAARGEVRRQKAMMTGKALAAGKTLASVESALDGAMTRLQSGTEQIERLQSRLKAGEELHQFKSRAFAAGQLSFYELEVAQEEVITVHLQLAKASSERSKAAAEVEAAGNLHFKDLKQRFLVSHGLIFL